MTSCPSLSPEIGSENLKSYIGLVRDHSGSMAHVASLALKDYNDNLRVLKESAEATGLDTYASVVKCGVGYGGVEREDRLAPLKHLRELYQYQSHGNTPLFDAVGMVIEDLELILDPDAVFLILATTDGQENASRNWSGHRLSQKIQSLQGSDRWTFTFRVPKGYGRPLAARLGVSEGNILEWEQTAAGFEFATRSQTASVASYYSGLTRGITSSTKFYSNLDELKPEALRQQLQDISSRVAIWTVEDGRPDIKEFCERNMRAPYIRGLAFYQLIKPETVQDHKELAIRDKNTGSVYSGSSARDLLGLPRYGSVRVYPGRHGQYELFVQSQSTNRILPIGTKVLYLVRPS